ncbi:MAG: DUF3467 domain-containing protein [Gammaproteobacteria bacterium]|jgi:hypothetical protein|nr:DUF3467 domain-containing protein [Gammaproteobacteria bacterium]
MVQQQPNKKRQIRLEIPANLNAHYANSALISQTHSEIILDFLQVMPNDPRAHIQARIAMTPANAKALLRALEQNLARFEAKNGEIKLPATLADQLFSGIKPPDDSDPDSEDQ